MNCDIAFYDSSFNLHASFFCKSANRTDCKLFELLDLMDGLGNQIGSIRGFDHRTDDEITLMKDWKSHQRFLISQNKEN